MSIYKRGDVYWYKFMWQCEMIRKSTKQGNDKVARKMEAVHRTRLAEGLVGIRELNRTRLADFIKDRFAPWAKNKFASNPTKTWGGWYVPGINALTNYKQLSGRVLREITTEHIADYASHLTANGLQASSVNSRLRVLRRMFHLAVEWGEIETAPKVTLLSGERHRERVVTPAEEQKYLAAAPSLLADISTVLIDSGMRPEELFRQRWENVTWINGRHGAILVTHGKTKAARRVLPLTPRVRAVLEQRWDACNQPEEGWMWPAPTKSGHIEPSTLKKQHRRALKDSGVRSFVLYSLRHSFLTRLGESGCDVWTLARIAGHSSIAISSRYVHPSADKVLDAMSILLSGHKTGHNSNIESKNELAQVGAIPTVPVA
jgi:integrase